jgi:hypothetical protein
MSIKYQLGSCEKIITAKPLKGKSGTSTLAPCADIIITARMSPESKAPHPVLARRGALLSIYPALD